jgi:hypothetical protein
MRFSAKRVIASQGFVYKKRNYFHRLNLAIWFFQLVVSYVIALS